MLTLKHIIWDGGFETVYEAKQVRVKYQDRSENSIPGSRLPIQFVAFDLPTNEVMELTFGKVYVTNELGKTVTSYDLDAGHVSSQIDAPKSHPIEYRPLPVAESKTYAAIGDKYYVGNQKANI